MTAEKWKLPLRYAIKFASIVLIFNLLMILGVVGILLGGNQGGGLFFYLIYFLVNLPAMILGGAKGEDYLVELTTRGYVISVLFYLVLGFLIGLIVQHYKKDEKKITGKKQS